MGSSLDQLKEKIFSKYQKDTWEIRTIGEIATEIISGNEVTREQLGSGDHPSVKCGDINSSLPIQFKECISFVDLNLIKKPKYFEKGDLLLSNMGGKDTVGTPVVYLGKEKCLAGDHVIVIKTNQNTKFLAYILSSSFAKAQIEKLSQKSTVYDLYPSKIKQIKVPLPSLEIQHKIVEFLDKFTELERELEMRKKQYEYYRELLFNRGIKEQNWPLKTIEEIAIEIISGNEITKAQLGTGNHPAIRFKQIHDSSIEIKECLGFVDENLVKNKRYAERGDIVIAQISENLEEAGKACVYLGNQRCLVGNHITVIKSQQNTRFLTFYLSAEFAKRQIKALCQKSTVFEIYKNRIKQIEVPVPPLEIQSALVEKLDLLFKIIYNFKEGIPLLIKKNREQYEFYRELILNKYS